MSFNNLIITGCEFLSICLLIIGFINEDKVIKWEQKTKRKIKRFIYNIIVKLEG